jgi:hypothetical protein
VFADGSFSFRGHIQTYRQFDSERTAKVISRVSVSTHGRDRRAARRSHQFTPELNWRAFAVRQNFSNGRRKVIDTGTWHNDAVPAAVSFFGDAQESSAVVFTELHIEVFALNLQFSRLDNVIHFYLEAAEFRQWNSGMEEKFLGIYNFVAVAAQNPRGSVGMCGQTAEKKVGIRRRTFTAQSPKETFWAEALRSEICIDHGRGAGVGRGRASVLASEEPLPSRSGLP